jgi:hypothetical protein
MISIVGYVTGSTRFSGVSIFDGQAAAFFPGGVT